jgi:hypothetical protein
MPTSTTKRRPRRPRLGPYGRARWNEGAGRWSFSLTPAGGAEFERWLREEGQPFTLLRAFHPSTFHWVSFRFRHEMDLVHNAALVGLWKALLRYDPAQPLFRYVAFWVLSEVEKLSPKTDNHRLERQLLRLGKESRRDGIVMAVGVGFPTDPAEDAERSEAAEAVHHELRFLPGRMRETVERHYGFGGDAADEPDQGRGGGRDEQPHGQPLPRRGARQAPAASREVSR